MPSATLLRKWGLRAPAAYAVGDWVHPEIAGQLFPVAQVTAVDEREGEWWYAVTGTATRYPESQLSRGEAPPEPTSEYAADAVLAMAARVDWPEIRLWTGTPVGPGEDAWRSLLPRINELHRGYLVGALRRRIDGVPPGMWRFEWLVEQQGAEEAAE